MNSFSEWPAWRKILTTLFVIALPFIGSIVKF